MKTWHLLASTYPDESANQALVMLYAIRPDIFQVDPKPFFSGAGLIALFVVCVFFVQGGPKR